MFLNNVGDLTIYNCTFMNNSAPKGDGGVFYYIETNGFYLFR